MDNLVPSLEVCKQLKEAGFPQKSYFYYAEWNGETMLHHWAQIPADRQKEAIAAPTAQEIADQLPKFIAKNGSIRNGHHSLEVAIRNTQPEQVWVARLLPHIAEADTMAEALAALYIKLQEVK